MNIKFTITIASIINFIIGVLIICAGLYLLDVKPAESLGDLFKQMVGLIAIGLGGSFKLIKD